MYISNIKWPEKKDEIMRLYLSFMIKVLDVLEYQFPSELGNPLGVARTFLADKSTEDEYCQCLELSWDFIDERDAIREFTDKKILSARLAISLLSTNKNLDEVGEKLAWFFEVLDHLRVDIEKPLKLMRQHFEFES